MDYMSEQQHKYSDLIAGRQVIDDCGNVGSEEAAPNPFALFFCAVLALAGVFSLAVILLSLERV